VKRFFGNEGNAAVASFRLNAPNSSRDDAIIAAAAASPRRIFGSASD